MRSTEMRRVGWITSTGARVMGVVVAASVCCTGGDAGAQTAAPRSPGPAAVQGQSGGRPAATAPGSAAAAKQPAAPSGQPGPTDASSAALRAQLEKATADYAAAFNTRDFQALANQWTSGALLMEGGGELVGRERIVESISAWAGRNPESKIEMRLTGVMPLGATVVRVKGVARFTPQPNARVSESHFVSLRVLVDGQWQLAESIVAPSQDVAMDQLDWLLGTWTATDPADGTVLESRYERAADGHVILGRTTITPKEGTAIESIDVIHADTGSGTIRSWVFDSTGARAEGVFETDGTAFNRVYEGLAAHGAKGLRTRWVQMVVPTSPTTIVMQSIERSLDGRPVADGRPWHLVRKPAAAATKP